MAKPGWLPDLVFLKDFYGDWTRYINAIYEYFRKDFVESRPLFKGERLNLKRYPLVENREATFWHLISAGCKEEDRLPDLRRCERIRWPKPIIVHCDDDCIRVWENTRKEEKRICLWFVDQEFLVVLARRKSYLLLWTAYPVTENHRKRKLAKEFEDYLKS
jgi:hypothetical protein